MISERLMLDCKTNLLLRPEIWHFVKGQFASAAGPECCRYEWSDFEALAHMGNELQRPPLHQATLQEDAGKCHSSSQTCLCVI